MPGAAEILTALRPAHIPPSPAFGWSDLLLPAALGLFAALVLALAWPRRIRGRRRVSAQALDALSLSAALPAPEARVAEARLLRRLVGALDGETAAGLDGPRFADHLDRRFSTDFFTGGAGRAITIDLYAPDAGDGAPEAEDTRRRRLAALIEGMKA